MSYEELGNLINENKADEVREALNGMSEQELGLFMDLLDNDQADYLAAMLAEDAPVTEELVRSVEKFKAGNPAPELKDVSRDILKGLGLSDFEVDAIRQDAWLNLDAKPWPSAKWQGDSVDLLEANDVGEGMTPEEIDKWFNHFGVKYERGDTDTQGSTTYKIYGEPSAIQNVIADYENMANMDYKYPWEREDVNGDGDTDVAVADTNDNGEADTAVVKAESKSEEKEAVKSAKEKLGVDKKDKTSTGKTKKELEDDGQTLSDARQKNIISALLDHRF